MKSQEQQTERSICWQRHRKRAHTKQMHTCTKSHELVKVKAKVLNAVKYKHFDDSLNRYSTTNVSLTKKNKNKKERTRIQEDIVTDFSASASRSKISNPFPSSYSSNRWLANEWLLPSSICSFDEKQSTFFPGKRRWNNKWVEKMSVVSKGGLQSVLLQTVAHGAVCQVFNCTFFLLQIQLKRHQTF